MAKPRLLDLFCGAGGCSMGYHRAGFDVVGVDSKPQKNYPFEFHQADAMTYPLKGYDVIHASPPCQAYSALKTMANSRVHPDLVGLIRKRLLRTRKQYVIENVFGAPLKDPMIMLCGSYFNLTTSNGYQLRRHRYFEMTYFMLSPFQCNHSKKTIGIYGAKGRDIAKEKRHYAQDKAFRGKPDGIVLNKKYAFEAMGIEWMNMDELSESIPPAYTEWIGNQLIKKFNGN